MKDKEIKDFVKIRNEAVWSFSIPKFMDYLKAYFPEKAIEDFKRFDDMQKKGVMAKMCFQITDTPTDVLLQAEIILNKLGWKNDIY